MFLFGPRVHLVGWKTGRIENGEEKIVFWVVWFGKKRGKILVGLKYFLPGPPKCNLFNLERKLW